MPELRVSVVQLEPMTVASSRAVGESPEPQAWEQLRAWAEPQRLLEDLSAHPVFGFNNPNPSAGSVVYGYEFWIAVAPGTQAEGKIEIKEFPGGLFAATSCSLQGEPDVTAAWKLLGDWVEASGEYQWRKAHELEKILNPMSPPEQMMLELYLPVEAAGAR